MSHELVERVARALCREIGVPEDGVVVPERMIAWKTQMPKARAAIRAHEEALAEAGYVIVPREPTEAMINSGWVCLFNGPQGKPWAPHRCWQAMCDAMLGEEEGK